jgi:hypothetical protein
MTERDDWETGSQMAVVSWSNAAQIGGGRDVGGEFIVAAADVLQERLTGGQDPRGPAAL